MTFRAQVQFRFLTLTYFWEFWVVFLAKKYLKKKKQYFCQQIVQNDHRNTEFSPSTISRYDLHLDLAKFKVILSLWKVLFNQDESSLCMWRTVKLHPFHGPRWSFVEGTLCEWFGIEMTSTCCNVLHSPICRVRKYIMYRLDLANYTRQLKAGPLWLKQPTNKFKTRIVFETSIPYLNRHASFILIMGLHL